MSYMTKTLDDELENISIRLASCMTTYKENATEDAPFLLAVVEAVRDEVEQSNRFTVQNDWDRGHRAAIKAIENAIQRVMEPQP